MAAGLDPIPGIGEEGGLVPPCAPADLSNRRLDQNNNNQTDKLNIRFYDALPGPSVFLNATAYGHGDILDQLEVDVIDIIKFCKSNPETDKAPYRWKTMNTLLYPDLFQTGGGRTDSLLASLSL